MGIEMTEEEHKLNRFEVENRRVKVLVNTPSEEVEKVTDIERKPVNNSMEKTSKNVCYNFETTGICKSRKDCLKIHPTTSCDVFNKCGKCPDGNSCIKLHRKSDVKLQNQMDMTIPKDNAIYVDVTPDLEIKQEMEEEMENVNFKEDLLDVMTNFVKCEPNCPELEDTKEINPVLRLKKDAKSTKVEVCRGCGKPFQKLLRHLMSKSGKFCTDFYTSQDISEEKKKSLQRRRQYLEKFRDKRMMKMIASKDNAINVTPGSNINTTPTIMSNTENTNLKEEVCVKSEPKCPEDEHEHSKVISSESEFELCRGCRKPFQKILRHLIGKSGKFCKEFYSSQDIQGKKEKSEEKRRQYKVKYREINQEKQKQYRKIYEGKLKQCETKDQEEESQENCSEINGEKRKQYKVKFREINRDKQKQYEAKYRQSEKYKEKQKQYEAKYRQSEKYKEKQRQYEAKYRMSEKYKEKQKQYNAKYRQTESGKEKQKLQNDKVKRTKMLQKLLEIETVKPMSESNYLIWETLFIHFLKLDKKYSTFLDPTKTWACLNDDINRGQSNEDIDNLDNLVTTLASYGPKFLHQSIVNECTSLAQFFEQICDFFDIPSTWLDEKRRLRISQEKNSRTKKINRTFFSEELSPTLSPFGGGTEHSELPIFVYNTLRNSFRHNQSMSYHDFYCELRSAKYEILMKEQSDTMLNGSSFDTNEKMTSDIENEIVINWLEGIDERLPEFIQQKYSTELETISLHELQGDVNSQLDSHLLEIDTRESGTFTQIETDDIEADGEVNIKKKLSVLNDYVDGKSDLIQGEPSNCNYE